MSTLLDTAPPTDSLDDLIARRRWSVTAYGGQSLGVGQRQTFTGSLPTFHYIVEGESTVAQGDRTTGFRAGDFVLLPRGGVHTITAEQSVRFFSGTMTNGVKFEAPVIQGQKTGWFYDHRMNRARLAPYAKGKRVLDLYSYIGGWGVQAAAFGASEVFCVDASAFALDGVERNAALNGFAEKMTCIEGDVFEALKELKASEERFDVIVADPPAFIKRKKDMKNGEGAYRRLNEQAMRLLSKDGILVSASCSMHLPEDDLQNILLTSARHLDRNIQMLERGGQGPDHPVHPAIAETRYIKSITCRLLPNS
ncbi:MAG: SAM-dependent methyltransferase [Pseudomonas sp.]|nr:SAM-dependent methyltransferase [Pseudomonas sp.]